jgi:hypothetical protein
MSRGAFENRQSIGGSMGASNPRPSCGVTNSTGLDHGTSALICTDAPCSTGRPGSFTPEGLWADIVNSRLPLSAQDKVYTLAQNFQLFARLQGNVDLKPDQLDPQPLANPDLYDAYAERMQARHDWVHAIANSRRIVRQLNAQELGLSAEQLDDLRGYLNHRLSKAAPYYTQMANLNLLEGDSRAWTRTCNLTSLSMSLEALGIGPEDFNGDRARLQRIAETLEVWRYDKFKKDEEKEEAKKKKYKNYKRGPVIGAYSIGDVTNLRMPDFLQFVAVYVVADPLIDTLTGDAFLTKIGEARTKAASKVILYETLIKIASLFGVKCVEGKAIHSYGEKVIGFEKAIKADDKVMMKAGSNLTAYGKAEEDKDEQTTALADFKEKYAPHMEKSLSTYQSQILERIAPELDRGNQVFLHKPGVPSGHYMKLHDLRRTPVDSPGVIIDDPWSPGKHSPLTWREAFNLGYFDSYMVLSK